MQTSAVMASHASTSEWQSFEMRMRRRRAERLLLRADVATEAGCFDDARECLAEIRALAPSTPGLEDAERKLRDYIASPPPERSSDVAIPAPVVVEAAMAAPAVIDSVIGNRVISEPVISDSVIADRVVADRVIGDSVIADSVLADPVIEDSVVADSVVADRVIADPVASSGRRNAVRIIVTAAASIAIVAAVSAWFMRPSPVAPAPDVQSSAIASQPATSEPTTRVEAASPPSATDASPASTIAGPPAATPQTVERAALESTASPTGSAGRSDAGRDEPAREGTAGPAGGRPEPARSAPTRPEAPRPEVPRITASAANDLPGVTTGAPAVPPTTPEPRETPAASALAPVSMPDPIIPATATKAAIAAPADVSQDALVRNVLNRYASAYSALDAGAAQRVWPGVNRAALSKAFDALASQRVSLGECRIQVSAATAHAQCAGSATWSPKVGNGASRTESRTWTFDLARAGSGWQIVGARVQNR